MQAPSDLRKQLVSELISRDGTGNARKFERRKRDTVHKPHEGAMHVGQTCHYSRLRRVLLTSAVGKENTSGNSLTTHVCAGFFSAPCRSSSGDVGRFWLPQGDCAGGGSMARGDTTGRFCSAPP